MANKRGRPKRYLTEKEYGILEALRRHGVSLKHALSEIGMSADTYQARRKEAMSDSALPAKELSAARKRNMKYIFNLIKAEGEHVKTLVDRLDLDVSRNVRWLLATLYPDSYSQHVAENRLLRDDVIETFDEPSEAQTQASELLAEGDTPNVPGME